MRAGTDGFVDLVIRLWKSAHLMVSIFPIKFEARLSVECDSDVDRKYKDRDSMKYILENVKVSLREKCSMIVRQCRQLILLVNQQYYCSSVFSILSYKLIQIDLCKFGLN